MKNVAYAFIIIACFSCATALKCYVTSEDKVVEKPCIGSCQKSVTTYWDHADTTYSCTMTKEDDGCSSAAEFAIIIEGCFCNTDLCNSSSGMTLALPLLLVALLVKIIV